MPRAPSALSGGLTPPSPLASRKKAGCTPPPVGRQILAGLIPSEPKWRFGNVGSHWHVNHAGVEHAGTSSALGHGGCGHASGCSRGREVALHKLPNFNHLSNWGRRCAVRAVRRVVGLRHLLRVVRDEVLLRVRLHGVDKTWRHSVCGGEDLDRPRIGVRIAPVSDQRQRVASHLRHRACLVH